MKLLMHIMGLDNATGPYYLFWSGIGGNLAFMLGGLAIGIAFVRRAEKRVLDFLKKPTDF